jgi:hypothetical protein
MAANRVYIQVDVGSADAEKNIANLNKGIKGLGDTSKKAGEEGAAGIGKVSIAIEQSSKAMEKMARALEGLAIAELGKKMLEAAEQVKRMDRAFTGMLGSAEAAAKMMEQIRAVAKGGLFSEQDLDRAGRALLNMGLAAGRVPGALQAISDHLAKFGGTPEDIDTITEALARMREMGALDVKEFKQLSQLGVDVVGALNRAGWRGSREQIVQAMREQRISGAFASTAILDEMARARGAGAAARKDEATAALKDLNDNFRKLSVTIAEILNPPLSALINMASDAVNWFRQLPNPIKETATALGLIAAALVSINTAWSLVGGAKIAEWIGGMAAARGAAGVAAAAAGEGAVAGGAAAGGAAVAAGLGGLSITLLAGIAIAVAAAAGWGISKGIASDMFQDWLTSHPGAMGAAAAIQGVTGVPILKGGFVGPHATPEQLEKAATDTQQRLAAEDSQRKKELAEKVNQDEKAIDASRQRLAAARAAEVEGLAAIEIKFRQIMYEDRGIGAALANDRLAKQIEIEREMYKYSKQTDAMREENQKAALEDEVRAYNQAAQREAQIAGFVIQDTADKRAEVLSRQVEIEIGYAEQIRTKNLEIAELTHKKAIDDLEDEKRRQLSALETTKGMTAEQVKSTIERRQQVMDQTDAREKVADEKMAQNRVQVNRDADDEIAKHRRDMYQQLMDQATRDAEQTREITRQTTISHMERVAATGRLQFETGFEVTPQEKIGAIQAAAAYDMQQAEAIAQQKQVYMAEDLQRQLEAIDTLGAAAKASQADINLAKDKARALDAASELQLTGELADEEKRIRIETNRDANRIIVEEQREIFSKFENAVGQIFDAMFDRSKSFWRSIGDMALKAGKDLLKTAIVPTISASLMTAAGMPVELAPHGDYGTTGLGHFLGQLVRHPVFGSSNMESADLWRLRLTGNGSVPVVITGQTSPAKAEVKSDQKITIRHEAAGGAAGAGGGGWNLPFLPGLSPMMPLSATPSEVQQAARITTTFTGDTGVFGQQVANLPGYTAGGGGGAGLGGILSSLGGGGAAGGAAGGAGLGQLGTLASLANMPLIPQNAPQMMQMIGKLSSLKGLGGGLSGLGTSLAGLIGPAALVGGIAGVKGGFDLGQWAQRQTGARKALGAAGAVGLGALSGVVGMLGLATMFPELLIPFLAAGPIGWIAAAGVGAAIALIGLMKKSDTQHARDLIKQMYGIDIRNQQVLAQVVAIAKQKYGGAISLAVASPEVQQLVNLYAATQGMGPVGPRPMYPATFAQSAAGLQLQPTYSNGQLVASPYSGTTTQQWATAGMLQSAQSQNLLIQLDPRAASQLFSGQVVNVINSNPTAVGNANTSSIVSGSNRSSQLGGLLEPGTVYA